MPRFSALVRYVLTSPCVFLMPCVFVYGMVGHSFQGMQTKVHEAIKEHEAASEKVHSLKKGSPKIPEAQAHLATTQQQMDLLSFAYVNKLKQTLIDVSMVMFEKFTAFFGEATVYSMSVNTQTSALIPELTRQQADLKKQKQSNDEERGRELKRLATASSSAAGSGSGSSSETSSSSSSSASGTTPVVANTTTHQIKQGYIFCRGGGGSGKYKQRWVSILNARLMVYKNWQAREAEKTFNLVLCNVKRIPADSSSHPFVFEVRSNMDECMQFAATDEIEMTQWINVIQNVIAAQLGQNLLHSSSSSSSSSTSSQHPSGSSDQYLIITSVKGNDKCADCRAPGTYSLFLPFFSLIHHFLFRPIYNFHIHYLKLFLKLSISFYDNQRS